MSWLSRHGGTSLNSTLQKKRLGDLSSRSGRERYTEKPCFETTTATINTPCLASPHPHQKYHTCSPCKGRGSALNTYMPCNHSYSTVTLTIYGTVTIHPALSPGFLGHCTCVEHRHTWGQTSCKHTIKMDTSFKLYIILR